MYELVGKFTSAKIFAKTIEEEALAQILELLNQSFMKDSKVRIMPDCHAGKGCTIGTTLTIKDKVVSNLVGVDIGCGMHVIQLKEKSLDFKKLDDVIHNEVPSGFNVRKKEHKLIKELDLTQLRCAKEVDISRAKVSVGSLGGGNHFIEVDQDDEGFLYLVLHSGGSTGSKILSGSSIQRSE